ncbi:hypothetical protein ILUMI_10329 [Ignelater luminosus]|uniref:Peptidase M14 domain-containing protein n=1 Tax=Ignelater luminosus TaxID=2038154 RepID=A0A8K0GE92_IGNLU|nr:hypothetical protein ILUMI_10329 [Ignelater luminosus]
MGSCRKQNARSNVDVFGARRDGNSIVFEGAITKEGEDALRKSRINFNIKADFIPGYNKTIDINTTKPGIINGVITWNRVLLYEEIISYVRSLPSRSTKNRKITVKAIGKSYEKRPIYLVKIEHLGANHVVFFDAGIHAREWLSIMTAMNVIQRVLLADERDHVNLMNWYIVPMVNPDGFLYSQNNFSFHRGNKNFTGCPKWCKVCGVDLNRNFAFKWEKLEENLICSWVWPGRGPASEPETIALSNTLLKYSHNVILYIALHTYWCKFFYPWGYKQKKVKDYKDLIKAALNAAKPMSEVSVDPKTCTFAPEHAGQVTPSGGGADDFARAMAKVKYVYTLELQKSGLYGYHPYDHEVGPFVEANYEGLKKISIYVDSQYQKSSKKIVRDIHVKNVEVSRSTYVHRFSICLYFSLYIIAL